MAEERHDADPLASIGDESEDGLVEAVEQVVEYRVRTRRGQAHPAPRGDLSRLSAAVDGGLARADGSDPEPDEPAEG